MSNTNNFFSLRSSHFHGREFHFFVRMNCEEMKIKKTNTKEGHVQYSLWEYPQKNDEHHK